MSKRLVLAEIEYWYGGEPATIYHGLFETPKEAVLSGLDFHVPDHWESAAIVLSGVEVGGTNRTSCGYVSLKSEH